MRKKLGLRKNELKSVVGHGYILAKSSGTNAPNTQV